MSIHKEGREYCRKCGKRLTKHSPLVEEMKERIGIACIKCMDDYLMAGITREKQSGNQS